MLLKSAPPLQASEGSRKAIKRITNKICTSRKHANGTGVSVGIWIKGEATV